METRVPPPLPRRHRLHGDRPLQLTDHQVAHDRKPEARRPLDVEALGQAQPVVPDLDPQRRLVIGHGEVDVAHRRVAHPASGTLQPGRPVLPAGVLGVERVLHRVLQELGHRHGEGRGHVGRHVAEVTVDEMTIGWATPPSPPPSATSQLTISANGT